MNGRLLTEEGLVSGRTLLISGARIEALVDPTDSRCSGVAIVDLEGQLLLPGFIDVQVNGGGGVLFNDDPSLESIRAIGAAHRRFGTTGFLPTLISDDLDTIGRAITAVQSAVHAGLPGVLGIHIEGPFLNQVRRGVHESKHLRVLDASLVSLLSRLRDGRTVLTLAPEMTTPEIIARLVAAGILVSAGHSEASYAGPPWPSRMDCAASRICSMPWRASSHASPALSAPRCTTRTPGAASSSMVTTSIR
jgi:N-acetylglucosamine-6-phosphate deacetylase